MGAVACDALTYNKRDTSSSARYPLAYIVNPDIGASVKPINIHPQPRQETNSIPFLLELSNLVLQDIHGDTKLKNALK